MRDDACVEAVARMDKEAKVDGLYYALRAKPEYVYRGPNPPRKRKRDAETTA